MTLSMKEVEYVACSSAIHEAVWLRRFLQHLEIFKTTSKPMTIYCDSMAMLSYAKDPKYHGKTKHISIKYHFFKDNSLRITFKRYKGFIREGVFESKLTLSFAATKAVKFSLLGQSFTR